MLPHSKGSAEALIIAARNAASSERAREILEHAWLEIREDHERTWQSSRGAVRAFRVCLHLTEANLALVSSTPWLQSAVMAALSKSAPSLLGGSVIDISFEAGANELGGRSYRE